LILHEGEGVELFEGLLQETGLVVGDGQVHEEDEFEFGVVEVDGGVFEGFEEVDSLDEFVVFDEVFAFLDNFDNILILEMNCFGIGLIFFAQLVLGGGGRFFVFGGFEGDGLGAGK
jgi:hypothetical protein